MHEWARRFFVCFPEFPEKPFLSIPKAKRDERLAAPPFYKLCEHNPEFLRNTKGELMPLNTDYLRDSKEKLITPPMSYTVCCIMWQYTDNFLLDAFEAWLKDMRKRHPEFAPEEARGRAEYRSTLKKLGALRLLKHLTWEQAGDYTQEILCNKPLYSEESAWSRAKSEAEELIQHVRSFVLIG